MPSVPPAHLDPVDAGQHQVEDDEVVRLRIALERCLAVGGYIHLVAVLGGCEANGVGNRILVLDHKQAR